MVWWIDAMKYEQHRVLAFVNQNVQNAKSCKDKKKKNERLMFARFCANPGWKGMAASTTALLTVSAIATCSMSERFSASTSAACSRSQESSEPSFLHELALRMEAIEYRLGIHSKKNSSSSSSTPNRSSDQESLKKKRSLAHPYDNYPVLELKKHRSLMAKYLTHELYHELKDRKTSFGFTLDQAIQTGIDTPYLGIGIIAGDEECYEVFKELMDLIIEAWHGFGPTDQHHSEIDPTKISKGMFPEKYVISSRVRTARNIRGLAFPAGTTRGERREVERLLSCALMNLSEDLKGRYYPLSQMTKKTELRLIDDHFLFQKPASGHMLATAGAARDWPDGRGIFHNLHKTFLVWINEEDHMRVISMQEGGNMQQVFERFCRGLREIESLIEKEGREYSHDDRLGFLCTNPSNLGTALRSSVMIKLPFLSQNSDRFFHLCSALGLEARGANGERSPVGPGGLFDISNKARLGYSEVELVQTMIDGVWKLIELEEDLRNGVEIDGKVAKICLLGASKS